MVSVNEGSSVLLVRIVRNIFPNFFREMSLIYLDVLDWGFDDTLFTWTREAKPR